MEWAVWTASSDSEDGMAPEINEEEGSPSKRNQQDSLYGAGEQSSTKDAHGSVDLTSVKEVASTRNGWHSMDPGKAEAGKKPSDKSSQNLIHFEKKQGIKPSAPDSMGSTRMVNISEGAGIPDRDTENITMSGVKRRMRSEEEDEEQDLITQEDLGESAEELEFDSSISRNAVSQKLNRGRSETQGKKRKLSEDGLDQVSKPVKRLEPPQENQLHCASSECGESASVPSCSQMNEGFQSTHLEGNRAAEAPVNCTESKKMLIHSSELVEHQEVRTEEMKFHCTECHLVCRNAKRLKRHLLIDHKNPYQCPECIKCFKKADEMSEHRQKVHKVKKPFQCTECYLPFTTMLLLAVHRHTAHTTVKVFKCPECDKCFAKADAMSNHRLTLHSVEKPFQCTVCNLTFDRILLRNQHHRMAHGTAESLKCPECKKSFLTEDSMSLHRLMAHNVAKPYQCTVCNLTFSSIVLRDMHRHTSPGMKKTVVS